MFPTLAQFSRGGALAFVAVFATIALPPNLHAALPANDTCGGAILVPGVPYLSPVIDVLEATTNGDPVALPSPPGLTRSIWFKFIPAASDRYTLSVGEDTETNFGDLYSTDTVIGLYRSASGCGGPLTLVAENDDSGGVRSALSTNLNAGATYFLVVWVGMGSQDTNHALNVQLRVTRPVVPANDLCSGAIPIPTATFPYVSPNIDTLLATSANDPVSTCSSFRGVWFTFAPTVSGTYILGLDREPATSMVDPTLAIFTSTGGCNGPFSELTCTNNQAHQPIIIPLNAGTTHYILIADIELPPCAGATAVQLRVSRPGPPTVTTLPASSINSTSAVLNTVINPNGFLTRYYFEWGTTTSYGNMTPNRQLSSGAAASPVNTDALLDGITPGVTYHYRAVGSNEMGKIFGADQSFRYSTTRPTIVGHSVQPGGNFHFRFTANSNQVYLIQSTTNLMQWSDWGSATDLGDGSFDFSVSGTPGPRRFFKVRSP
ncbi:MAG TPA: hypothetical protein VFT34_19510 [Verrucomicrobiae bacterium]|nr:hypothetical protein [Verrucomicrobiae bacterium]